MAKTLIAIHGRSWKPPRRELRKLWFEAIKFGLQRDAGSGPDPWAAIERREFIYYGDVSNRFLEQVRYQGRDTRPQDSAGRWRTLDMLKKIQPGQFNKKHYKALPGKESFTEGAADVLSPLLSFFHLTEPLIAAVAPDVNEYWSDETAFGSQVRQPMIKPLQRAIKRKDSICIVAHSLGSMIAFDTLWKASHYGEWQDYRSHTIDLLLTLGSPLGDATVQRHLKGARNSGAMKYPTNIRRWINFAAEDDYISHDSKIRGDYREMSRLGLVESIRDRQVYNLAVRNGKSNPHHSAGYLIHPHVSEALRHWALQSN